MAKRVAFWVAVAFVLFRSATAAADTCPPPQCPIPVISKLTPTTSSIKVEWTAAAANGFGNGAYQFFQVGWTPTGPAVSGRQQSPQLPGGSFGWTFPAVAGESYTVQVQGCFSGPSSVCSEWASANVVTPLPPAAPQPEPPGNLQTSNSGAGILVLWNNPPGVQKATVSRTPSWPNATTTLHIAAPWDNLQDELAVTGQLYSYNVCLYFQTGNSCESVTGQLLAQTPSGTGTGMSHIKQTIPPGNIVGTATGPSRQVESEARPGLVAPVASKTCQPGFVWRGAFSGDQVCVTPQARDQAAADNSAASTHQTASGQCASGYVWRAANPEDHVCVTPQTRAQTAEDNTSAHYTPAP